MRLLDRYLLRELLVPFSYCLFGFLILYTSFDLLEQLSDFQKLKMTPGDILAFYAIKTPEVLVVILPIVFLLALLFALTNHARHHEITAIRAAGVSLFRLSIPYLSVGLILSGIVLFVNEVWVPRSLEAAEEIMGRHKQERVANQPKSEDKLGFYNFLEHRWWFIESYDVASGGMRKPRVIWLRPPDGPRTEILAEGAAYVEGVWVFTNGYLLVYATNAGALPEQQPFESLSMESFKETPDQIRSEIKIALETTMRRGFAGAHCLCHGALGNLETLLLASEAFADSQLALTVNRLASAVVESFGVHGWVCGNPMNVESPGLMTGVAGIGYQLLRLAEPRAVPSVLALEAPIETSVSVNASFAVAD